jgi:hypothetical protein
MHERLLTVFLAGVIAAACTAVESPAAGPPVDGIDEPIAAPAEPIEDLIEPEPVEAIAASWVAGSGPVDLADGWRVRDCEGDAPLLCIELDGDVVGTLSLDSYPLTAEMAAADDETALAEALRAFADSRAVGIADDRVAGCGGGYRFRAEPVVDVTMAGHPGVRYGFRGTEDGVLTEYVLSYATVEAGQIWIVVADGAADGGCMGDVELDLFDPVVLERFAPTLDRIVAGTPLPVAGSRVEDRTIVGVDGGLDGGLVYVVAGHEKHRIQQPRAMSVEEAEDEGLRRGDPIVRVRTSDSSTGSFFAVVPADGPEARLHLIVDGVMHPVVIQEVDAAALEGLTDADPPVLAHLRPATDPA